MNEKVQVKFRRINIASIKKVNVVTVRIDISHVMGEFFKLK
jgi:hypothetical protein